MNHIQSIMNKANTAKQHYGHYSSPHEVLGVIEEELYELKKAIHENDWVQARKESEDIAAVCIRFATETTKRELSGEM